MTLLPDTPREIKTPLNAAVKALMVMALMGAPLLLTLAVMGPDALKCYRVADRGREHTAVITRLYDRSSRNGHHTHYASYSYTIDGRSYAAEDRLLYERGEDLRADAQLPILYDPFDPTLSVVNRGENIKDRSQQSIQSLELLSGIAFLPFLFAVIAMSARHFKERRLLKWGSAASATIVAEERCKTRNGESITLHYEFSDIEGTIYRGERAGVPLPESGVLDQAKRRRLMAMPIALYHPKHPELNVLYPLDMVKLRYEMPILSSEIGE